ncbi:hypothetical protein HKX48_009291 [Thoreauomyces humboldtii]|nr:hypothetical protein HKX48_009291 [Thoreauomyces humboldtii]
MQSRAVLRRAVTAAASRVSRAAQIRCSSRVASATSLLSINRTSTATSSSHFSPSHAFQRRAFSASAAPRKDVPFLLADIGEGITECEVIQWFVKEGDRVEQFSRICEVQSDKAAVEITSRYDGVIKKLHYAAGDVARVGQPLILITTGDASEDAPTGSASPAAAEPMAAAPAAAIAETPAPSAAKSGTTAEMEHAYTLATPAVRRIARENSVDLAQVVGTGPSGRVLKGDVLAYVSGTAAPKQAASSSSAAPASTASSAPATNALPVPADRTVALGPIQKAMFKAMTKSLQIPHFGFSEEIVLNATSEYRASVNRYLKQNPEKYTFKKISYMPIFMKAMSLALEDFAVLNARVIGDGADVSKVQLQYRGAHNIGIAMDTANGLVVPNVKNCNQKSILDIAADLERLKESGKRNALSPSDMKDGTITLSNVGNIGGTVLHPVLVSSEVCIGAIGKVQRLPRFETVRDPATGRESEKVVAKEILNVSFNADHRVIDGATVARFVKVWKGYLEDPASMSARMR